MALALYGKIGKNIMGKQLKKWHYYLQFGKVSVAHAHYHEMPDVDLCKMFGRPTYCQYFYLEGPASGRPSMKRAVFLLARKPDGIFELLVASKSERYKARVRDLNNNKFMYVERVRTIFEIYKPFPNPVNWRLARLYIIQNADYLLNNVVDPDVLGVLGIEL